MAPLSSCCENSSTCCGGHSNGKESEPDVESRIGKKDSEEKENAGKNMHSLANSALDALIKKGRKVGSGGADDLFAGLNLSDLIDENGNIKIVAGTALKSKDNVLDTNGPQNPSSNVDTLVGNDNGQAKGSLDPLRDPVILREQVVLQLRRIIDPDLFQDIVTLGFVKNLKLNYETGVVSMTLELTTPACPVKDQFVEDIESYLKELGWVETVQVELTARKAKELPGNPAINLREVSQIVAVASCKGGVGKSSVACNLAYALHRAGASVGLVDCDIYGPSLPFLIPIPDAQIFFKPSTVKQDSADTTDHVAYEEPSKEKETPNSKQALKTGEGALIPLFHHGVKLMSYGYFKNTEYAAVRGPIVSNVVYQLVTQTLWGSLDYLIVDLPPGTGDIHLTLGQSVPISAAVVVTTPQHLSLADVERGIKMFNKMNIPTVAIVENMATFHCHCCGATHDVFGQNEAVAGTSAKTAKSTHASDALPSNPIQRIQEQFGVSVTCKLPLHPDFAASRFRNPSYDPAKPKAAESYYLRKNEALTSDTSNEQFIVPFYRAFDATHPVIAAINKLASDVVRECARLRYSEDGGPDLRALSDGMLELTLHRTSTTTTFGENFTQEEVLLAPARALRLGCRCAECVDEVTGAGRLKDWKIPLEVHVKKMAMTGNKFAVRIEWSDGHESLLAFTTIESIFRNLSSNDSTSRSLCAAANDANW